jgi:hypothetical protein
MVSKFPLCQMEMFFGFFFALGVNQYTIDEHYDKLVKVFHKDRVHQIHIVSRGSSQSKIHHCILVWTIPPIVGNLWKVTCLYFQLILSRLKINFREHTCTMEMIK